MTDERLQERIAELAQLEEELFGKLNVVRGMRLAFEEVLNGGADESPPPQVAIEPMPER